VNDDALRCELYSDPTTAYNFWWDKDTMKADAVEATFNVGTEKGVYSVQVVFLNGKWTAVLPVKFEPLIVQTGPCGEIFP
jgi:hypothetical protein